MAIPKNITNEHIFNYEWSILLTHSQLHCMTHSICEGYMRTKRVAEQAYSVSKLPDKSDHEKINKLCVRMANDWLLEE
jgi:hypothetical protein